MPYLRIFDPAVGSIEHILDKPKICIGRHSTSDCILLEHPSVSREHAILKQAADSYRIQDTKSRAGVLVNGDLVKDMVLVHGDVIQISHYVMEYRTDDEARERRLRRPADSAVDRHIRAQFRLPPKGLKVRYRTLDVEPGSIFRTGDTLPVGGGGLQVPTASPVEPGTCLELELALPSGAKKRVLGEVQHVLETEDGPCLAIKLHRKDDQDIQGILSSTRRGSWITPPPRKDER